MYPILFHIGSIPVRTYGLLIAIAFISASYVIGYLAKKNQLDEDRVQDLVFWSFVVGLFGSRLLFAITEGHRAFQSPLDFFKIWEGGFVFFGGPLAVIPFLFWYLKKHGLPAWKTADVMVPGLTLAHAFGRIGCFGAGCCYGVPTDKPWGITFPVEIVFDPDKAGLPLHPTQLYESFSLFFLFAFLLFQFKRRKFDGQVALVYFITYPIVRSIIEIFRGDHNRGFVVDELISTSQFISIGVFVVALALLIRKASQSEEK